MNDPQGSPGSSYEHILRTLDAMALRVIEVRQLHAELPSNLQGTLLPAIDLLLLALGRQIAQELADGRGAPPDTSQLREP